jgi:hypothetical protein
MKWFIGALIILACIAIATWALAGDPQVKLSQVTGNHEKNAKQVQGNQLILTQIPEPTSMLTEIRAVMDSTRLAQQALTEELGPDPSSELTRRQGELKKTSRMRILQIQLKYAREEGKTGLERRIMTSIEDLQRPAAPGGPRLSGGISPTPVVQAAETPAGGSHR